MGTPPFRFADTAILDGLSRETIPDRRISKARSRPTKAKTTTKVPGPFVVEMAFAQIKPAKTNLSLFGRF